MPQLLDTSFPGFASVATHPRAALIIVHGLAEYADRYREIAQALCVHDVSCFAFDQRGHGARPGPRTHVARFDDFVEDFELIARAVRASHPATRLFVWGHSMGSMVATLAAARADVALDGVITSSASLEVFRRGLNPLNPLFRSASRILPRVRVSLGLDPAKISSVESVQRAYANDPQIPATASLRLIVEFAAACERCRTAAPHLVHPWLVIHGDADDIAPAHGSQILYDLLGSHDKKLVTYPGLRHEVHNEQPAAREAFIDLMTQWIIERCL